MLHVTSLIFKILQAPFFLGAGVVVLEFLKNGWKKGLWLFFLAFSKGFSERFSTVTTVTVAYVTGFFSYCCNGNMVVTDLLKTYLLLHSCYKLLHSCYRSCYTHCYTFIY